MLALLGVFSVTAIVAAAPTAQAVTKSKAHAQGTLTVGINNQFTSLDPARSQSGVDPLVLDLLYDTLINTNPKTLAYEPGLATSWTFTGHDRLVFALKLRQGVRFQDGSRLTAAAVKASLEHFIKTGVNDELEDVSAINVTGSYSLNLHLKKPDSAMPAVLSNIAGMIVSPTAVAKEGTNFATHPVGAGPFAFKSEVSGASVTLVRSRYYLEPLSDSPLWRHSDGVL